MNRSLMRHGFFLILLALVGGLFVPAMVIPRLGLSAHTIGLLSGTLLIAIGAAWPAFALAARESALMRFCWLYSSYANWLGCLLGAATGAGRMTPLAAGGAQGAAVAEAAVAFLLLSVALTAFIATGLAIFGLRAGSDD